MWQVTKLHPSHVTRSSDAGSFDEVCVNCGRTDMIGGWGELSDPCPAEPRQHRVARLIEAHEGFVDSTSEILDDRL